jgi:hypothetical protein
MLRAGAMRHVYVIGRSSALDVAAAVRSSVVAHADLVLLCVGRDLSQAQRDIVVETLRRSADAPVDVDVAWVATGSDLRAALILADRLTVLTDRGDGRGVERAIAEHRSATSARARAFGIGDRAGRDRPTARA